ncbi:hypothetical protein [Rhizobium terrae]|uniref:hypothetical protein n=1 Tax=Rhizobium terrae TaxID=2171756 RepID=UPI000E3EDF06|nr:hypothetical protein [Rhizobium terrae]
MRHPQVQPIAELVDALLEAGCDMWAVGRGYCIGEPSTEPHASVVKSILREFGPRDHLMEDISAYLRQIGRNVDRSV